MNRRIDEIQAIREMYGEVEHGAEFDWLLITRFALPEGWNRDQVEFLIVIPPGYPTTPPDNFYVAEGLRLTDGRSPNNYAEGQTVIGRSWAQFSFHAESWNPTPDPQCGDNLVSFVLAATRRLQEGA